MISKRQERMLEESNCKFCQKEIPKWTRDGKVLRQFCARTCNFLWRYKHSIVSEKQKIRIKKRLEKSNCKFCQKEMPKWDRDHTENLRQYCSKKCVCLAIIKRRPHRSMSAKGYPVIWKEGKYIFEHRLIMEKKIGRKLLPTEVIHHINEIKTDNRPENLQLMLKNKHDRLPKPPTRPIQCPNCKIWMKRDPHKRYGKIMMEIPNAK